MDLLIILLCIFVLLFTKRIEQSDALFGVAHTASINGVFVVLIFIRHFFQYITPDKWCYILWKFNNCSDQLIVVSFLFFSGYAFSYQISRKKEDYLRKIPRKIMSVYLIFLFTVFCFLIVSIYYGEYYDSRTILLSFIGMKSIGNSTWYIVAIIFMWIISYLALKRRHYQLPIATFLIALYILIMSFVKNAIFYNTVIAYLLGLYFEKYEQIIKEYLNNKYLEAIIVTIVLFAISWRYRSNFVTYEVMVGLFCLLLVLFSMKISFENKILMWLNSYSLEIYLTQRLLMIVMKDKVHTNLLYFIVCFILTMGLSLFWRYIRMILKGIIDRTEESRDVKGL